MSYIELDYAGWGNWPRLTHYPSGDTCLRQPWMSNRQWLNKKVEFLNKYPEEEIFYKGKEVQRSSLLL